MKNRRSAAAAALAFALGGATAHARADTGANAPAFDSRALAGYRRQGGATMTGALQVTIAGQSAPASAKNARVVAIPDSPYTRWWIARADAIAAHGNSVSAADADDKKLAPYEHVVATGDDGSFRFDGLPAGAYRVRGRLEAGFDRTSEHPESVTQPSLDGSTTTSTEYVTSTVHDRSFFWLESGLVHLGSGDVRAIAMHVAARRDIYGRRSQ